MTALNILLGVAAFVCLIFIVGEPKPPISDKKREHITITFVALVLLIIAANTIFKEGKPMAKQKVASQINLERLAGGAFAEKLNEALM